MPNASPRRAYAVITAAYWAFTLSDGALRMLVLLFLHGQGHSAAQIAFLFLFYEFFGVLTNLGAGYLGARFGLRLPLLVGLCLQVVALGALATRADHLSLVLVMVLQGLSGIAKDLTKMSAKSFLKLLLPGSDGGGLLRWVAWLTGSKNTLKGVGFFLGGFLLAQLGFARACAVLGLAVAIAWALAALLLPRAAGKKSSKPTLRPGPWGPLSWLSLSRLFLFASRDAWFVLALPLFLQQQWSWSYTAVGSALALWVIGYGAVQAGTPLLFRGATDPGPMALRKLTPVTLLLALPLAWIAWWHPAEPLALFAGLAVFGVIFAACSSLHSFSVLHLASEARVAQQVGGYYAANAAGRLLGTALSGALYAWGGNPEDGLRGSVLAALVLVALAAPAALPLRGRPRGCAWKIVSPGGAQELESRAPGQGNGE
ncbi:MAG: organoarsenical effux MFS transporter ArsJ [Planctomycetota bacterium]